ncbi:hypothetical protein ACWEO1_20585 [Kitasatospora cineracea]
MVHQTGAIGTQTISAEDDAAALGWTADDSDGETGEWSPSSNMVSGLGF